MIRKATKGLYAAIVFLFLYAPIAVLIIFSFNESKSRGAWGGFSFNWYRELLGDTSIMDALITTITVALLASIISTIIGTLAAIGMSGMRKRFRNILMNVTYLPVLNPDIVTGVSLLILFMFIGRFLDLRPGYLTLLLSHITFCIPYVILSVLPKFSQLNRNIYEAALDLGCPPVQAFFKVVFPDLLPNIVTGFLLAFTLSIDDFVISFFTTGPGVNTLSITIYSMARRGINPEINALSTIMFFVVLVMLIIVNARANRTNKKTQKAE